MTELFFTFRQLISHIISSLIPVHSVKITIDTHLSLYALYLFPKDIVVAFVCPSQSPYSLFPEISTPP